MLIPKIDRIIKSQRDTVRWYGVWLLGSVLTGAAVIVVTFILALPVWIGGIGGALFLMLSKAPMDSMRRLRDRITALEILRADAQSAQPDSGQESTVAAQLNALLSKMLEG